MKKFIGILLTLTIYLSTAQDIPTDKECCIMSINGKAVNLCNIMKGIVLSRRASSSKPIRDINDIYNDSLHSFYNINKDSLEKSGFFAGDTLFDKMDKIRLTGSELAFWGTVIDARETVNDSNCMFYLTEYTIIIDKMAGSFYDFKNGDTIFMRNREGVGGGCDLDIYQNDVHYSPHQKGKSYFFMLYNWHYLYHTLANKLDNGKYKDPFCADIFFDYHSNNFDNIYNYEDEIISLFKEFHGQ